MPSPSRTSKILRYTLIGVIMLSLAGLLSWYFFLRNQGDALRALDEGRGAGITPPSFTGLIGSTYGNIVDSIASLAGGGTETPTRPPRLWQITKTPVAGAGFVPQNAGMMSASSSPSALYDLRFVERGTGYMFEANPENGSFARLTNTLVPRVYEASVGVNGVLILRGLDEDTSFILTNAAQAISTSASGEATALTLSALPQDIRELVLSPSGEEVLYLIEQLPGFSIVRAEWNGERARRVGSVGVAGWHMEWLSDDRIVLTQNGDDNAPGRVYEFKNGTLSPLTPRASARTLLPRANSSALLYGSASGNSTLTARVDENASTISLPIRTTIDKCVWAPGDNLTVYCAVPKILPDARSQGATFRGESHGTDAWWKIDVSAGSVEPLYDPGGVGGIDVENPTIDANGDYIAFMNARDKSLWLLRISEN